MERVRLGGARVVVDFYTEMHGGFLKWIVLREFLRLGDLVTRRRRDWHADETNSLMRSADDGGFFGTHSYISCALCVLRRCT
jgi:hypothetical protein